MEITRKSMLSGIVRTRNLPITDLQLRLYEEGRLLLQQAFPHLSVGDREFIKTGITDDEWEATFSDPSEDDNSCF